MYTHKIVLVASNLPHGSSMSDADHEGISGLPRQGTATLVNDRPRHLYTTEDKHLVLLCGLHHLQRLEWEYIQTQTTGQWQIVQPKS